MWRDFPYRSGSKPMPKILHGMFWSGVVMVLVPIVAAVAKLFWPDKVTILLGGQDTTRFVLPAIVIIGAALAYGVWAEHEYARYLAMAVLIAIASWMIWLMFVDFSPALIVEVIGTGTALRYLVRNPDVIEYYTRRA